MKKILTSILLCLGLVMASVVHADDNKHTVELQMKDGDLIPPVLEVPAGKIIRIKIKNIGEGPVEFESTQLILEKVLAPGASSVVVIAPKKPGTYFFFDDFHLDKPKGKLIVK